MAWHDPDSWLTYSFGPNLPAILAILFISFSLPICLHLLLYKQRTPKQLPTFLILGPSGAGKTALVSHLETGTAAPTRPSQVPLTIQAILPASTIQGSAQYRSAADPTLKQRPRIQLVDTPGHPKLRSDALSHLLPSSSSGKKPTKLPQVDGVLFVADGTGLNSGDLGLSDAGEFLHDVLLALQRRYERAKSSRTNEIPVLIIASKDDLFTAAPAGLAKKALEKEVARVRAAKARGLMQVEEGDNPGDESALGGWQEGDGDDFTFGVMAEYGVKVDVVGCNVRDAENGVSRCWGWIGQSL